MKKNAGTFTILKLVQFVITLFSYLFRTLCKNTNLPAFSTPNLFLNLEWTRPKVEKTLSILALDDTAVCKIQIFQVFQH